MGNNSSIKGNGYITEKLQAVYDAIKRERPWDVRPSDRMYTTAKEKYLIELIKEGHDISEEIITHVVGRCYRFHELDGAVYVCWFGFILTRKEFTQEHFKCKLFHRLNKRLICHNGAIYFPIDILSNPFGEWHPDDTKVDPEIQEVYQMLKEKWPDHWYEDEMHKYTLKYLINIIKNGETLTKDMKRHVVDGCDKDHHRLASDYHCYSGFLLREGKLKTKNSSADIDGFCFHGGILNYIMNPKFYNHTGVRSIPVPELRYRKYQTAQEITSVKIRPDMKNVKNVYDRILQRDLISPKFAKKIRVTWQEKYLTDTMMLGEDIPNEVISHVLDGCYTWGHFLTEKYACCRGYILKRDEFSSHDVLSCRSHHMINKDLLCFAGRIYHNCAEIPKGSSGSSRSERETDDASFDALCLMVPMDIELKETQRLRSSPAPTPPEYIDRLAAKLECLAINGSRSEEGDHTYSMFQMNFELEATPRLPSRPAPPPPDHLDDLPAQQPDGIYWPMYRDAGNERQNNNEIEREAEEAGLQNAALIRHPNIAPPPEEVDI